MKFKFKLNTLMKQRKIEQDIAQRDYAEASEILRKHMGHIKELYAQYDSTLAESEAIQAKGGSCMPQLAQLNDFLSGQKIKIQKAREKARELMSIEEAKLEILIEKVKAHKILEKLKEKQQEAFRKAKNKKISKDVDDLSTIRYQMKR